MLVKNIFVIGGGIYGCLTALNVKYKNPNLNVTIIDNNKKLLTSFDSLKVKNYKFNNGFHGIELPRAIDLFEFLRKKIKIKLKIQHNNRFLYIKGSLIKYEDDVKKWPNHLQNYFISKKNFKTNKIIDFKKIITPSYFNFLKEIGKRYSNNFVDIVHLLIPWFTPSNFKLIDIDEGSIFRNMVRENKIKAKYGYPQEIVFSALQKPIQKKIREIGINMMLNTNFKIINKEIILINQKNHKEKRFNKDDKIFFCGSSASILSQIDKKLFSSLIDNGKLMVNIFCEIDRLPKNFYHISEILCADDKIQSISRISFRKKGLSSKYFIQVECFINSELEITFIKENIIDFLTKLIFDNKKISKIKLMDIKISRKVFFPKTKTIKKSHKVVQNWILNSKLNISNNIYFSPINMSKAWIWSKYNSVINLKK